MGTLLHLLDKGFNHNSIRPLIQHTSANIQVHEAILLKSSPMCPWTEHDSISVDILGNNRKIWWINSTPAHKITLRN